MCPNGVMLCEYVCIGFWPQKIAKQKNVKQEVMQKKEEKNLIGKEFEEQFYFTKSP